MLGMVYRHTGEGNPMNEDNLVKWGPGIDLAQPPDPTIVFDFRANDNNWLAAWRFREARICQHAARILI